MSGAASALFLLDIKGRVLIWRDYRGDVTAAQAERFFTKLIDREVNITFSFSIWYAICYLLIFWLFCRTIRNRKIRWCTRMEWPTCLYSTVTFTWCLPRGRIAMPRATCSFCIVLLMWVSQPRCVLYSIRNVLVFLSQQENCVNFRGFFFVVVVTCIRFCRCLSIILKS